MARIGMIGMGSWGTALAYVLSSNGHKVTMWSKLADEVAMINTCHEHQTKLPGVKLSAEVKAVSDMKTACAGMDMLVFAVPSVFVRNTAKEVVLNILSRDN